MNQRPYDRCDLPQMTAEVYEDLRQIAHRHLAGRISGNSLGTTALVHETFLKLSKHPLLRSDANHAPELYAIAASAMRSVLIDQLRRRKAAKRSSDGDRISLDEAVGTFRHRPDELIDLDNALTRLAEMDVYLARLVELRFYGGLTIAETADTLRVSSRTVRRDWQIAKMWLRNEIAGDTRVADQSLDSNKGTSAKRPGM